MLSNAGRLRDSRATSRMHARRLAEQHVHRHVDGRLPGAGGRDDELAVLADLAHHRVRTALAPAQPLEGSQAIGRDRERVALLRFVAPDLERTHAALFHRDLRQLEARATAGLVGEFRHGIRQTAGADVVNRQHRVALAECPATVDHLLRAALDLGVAALDRIEVQLLGVRARGQARCGAAAEADAHAGSAELHQQGSGRQFSLARLIVADVADAARDHDRLVIAVAAPADVLLVGAEVAEQVRPAELVVERRGADRALDHDRQRVGNAAGKTVVRFGLADLRDVAIVFPRHACAGKPQVRHRESAQPGLGLRAASRGALVADLATGAGRGARKRRDRRRMVVRFDLEDGVTDFVTRAVLDADGAVGWSLRG